MTLDPELLNILACPVCRSTLAPLGSRCSSHTAKADPQGLVCVHCRVVYPIRDEIPVMLAEEAVPLHEWEAGKREPANTPCAPG